MITPAIAVITLRCLVNREIMRIPIISETNESTSRGIAIPTPKHTKATKFVKACIVVNENENKRRIGPGLHGSAISPKKAPNKNAENCGEFAVGAPMWGIKRERSMSAIIAMLTIASKVNSIGQIMPITVPVESFNRYTKISPNANIAARTPAVTMSPSTRAEIRFSGS